MKKDSVFIQRLIFCVVGLSYLHDTLMKKVVANTKKMSPFAKVPAGQVPRKKFVKKSLFNRKTI